NETIAEDITQEVFLRAYTRMEQYRGEAKISTWLCSITINACRDYLRSWSHRKLVFSQALQGHQAQANSESAESEALRRLDKKEILERVLHLPLKYREVLVLHYFEELSAAEIAELLGMKEPTVRTRIQRGIAKLKQSDIGGVTAWKMEM
ncbi:MAG: sigma-70 family RNA polymerase sigma factor, partial [Tumebacillaceae bacterium]